MCVRAESIEYYMSCCVFFPNKHNGVLCFLLLCIEECEKQGLRRRTSPQLQTGEGNSRSHVLVVHLQFERNAFGIYLLIYGLDLFEACLSHRGEQASVVTY
jgi:hypothetical protein